MQFLPGGPAGGLAEAAVGRKGESVGRRELEAAAHSTGDVLDGLDVVALHVDDADGDVPALGNFTDDFQLGELTAGHLEVQLVHVELEKVGEHRGVLAQADRVALVVAKAKVRGQAAFAGDRLDGAVENIDEPLRVLPVCVAAHRRFVDGDLRAAGGDEILEFTRDDRDQFLGDGPAVGIAAIGQQASGERVRAGDAGLEGRVALGQALEALEIVNRAQPFGRLERTADLVFAALVVGRRAEASPRRALKVDALEEAVKRQVEVEPRLFAVGDHVESGGVLVVHRCGHGVVDHFIAVGVAELLEVLAGELQPTGEGVAADDGRAQRLLFHA